MVFEMAFRALKRSETFEERAPGLKCQMAFEQSTSSLLFPKPTRHAYHPTPQHQTLLMYEFDSYLLGEGVRFLFNYRPGARFSKSRKVYGPEKPTLKVRCLKTRKILIFETLHKCKLCLNAQLVDIKSSVHKRLHGF